MKASSRKASGSHYTPKVLADFVAEQISKHTTPAHRSALDPACGDGELLLALSRTNSGINLTGWDLDSTALSSAKERVTANFDIVDFLEMSLLHRQDDLFSQQSKFDIVIANPPYVRTQVLGAAKAQQIAEQFNLEGRVDIYFAFLEGIADVLSPNGIAGVIVSNRFMTTKSGAVVRERIKSNFDILAVYDFGDTKLFEAAVLPAVLILRKKTINPEVAPAMVTIYSSNEAATFEAPNAIEAIKSEGIANIGGTAFEIKKGTLDTSNGGIWRIQNEQTDGWLETVNSNTFCRFGDIGKIRVGIKTTADKVFVKKDWPSPAPELLRDLVTHESARRYKAIDPEKKVLYPQIEVNGKKKPVNLESYPISKAYLESHKEALSSRTYVIEAGREWFEIWVPHKPSYWPKPKLVFPDISEKPTFWLCMDGHIIQGDCYWLILNEESNENLLWLALAVGNSGFIEKFYDHSFNNKLYAGRRRFMTQYVEKFPLPDPSTKTSKEIITLVKRVYETTPSTEAESLAEKLELLINKAFNVRD